jgi:hypothetical protein
MNILSMALQSFCWTLAHFQYLNAYTQSVGLAGKGISPSQGRYLHTEQHKHRINAYRHPCLEWDSNPRSQRWSEVRQFMPYTERPLWSHSSTLYTINFMLSSVFILYGFLFMSDKLIRIVIYTVFKSSLNVRQTARKRPYRSKGLYVQSCTPYGASRDRHCRLRNSISNSAKSVIYFGL